MGRTPDGINARTKLFSMRATPAWLALIDAQRGDLKRPDYIRRLVEEDRRRIARDRAARTTGRTP